MWKASNKQLPALTLLEIIVSMGFLTILIAAGFQIFQLASRMVERTREYTIAELMANDFIELTISKRNEDWNSLEAGIYYFGSDPVWGLIFVQGVETVDGFTRSVTVNDVYRNAAGQIVTSGGTLDNDTKKADATVIWSDRYGDYQVKLTQYLTNWSRF